MPWLKWPWVQVTAVSGSIEQADSLIREIPKHNYHPSTPSQSIKIQRASTGTCLQANIYEFICIHLLAIIQLSISAHFLGSRSWMTGLTLASEGSGSLAKLQPLHELLHLRSGCYRGCRMSERIDEKWLKSLCKVYLVSVSNYWDEVSDTVC